MTIKEIFHNAASYLERYGWKADTYGDHGGPRCAVGAFMSASMWTRPAYQLDDMHPPGGTTLVTAAWERLLKRVGATSRVGVATWNDCVSKDEVVRTFRELAEECVL